MMARKNGINSCKKPTIRAKWQQVVEKNSIYIINKRLSKKTKEERKFCEKRTEF